MNNRAILSEQESFDNTSFISFISFYESSENVSRPKKAYTVYPYYASSPPKEDTVEKIKNASTIDHKELSNSIDIMNKRDVDEWIKKLNSNIEQLQMMKSLKTCFGCALIYFVIFGMMNGCLSVLKPLLSEIHGDFKANVIIYPFLILSFLLVPASTNLFELFNANVNVAVLLGSCTYITGLIILASFAYEYYANVVAMSIMGLGTSMLLLPTTRALNTWFYKHNCLAQSMLWVGASLGTLIMPYTLNIFISKYSLKIAFTYLVVLSAFLLFIAGFNFTENLDYLLREKLLQRQEHLNSDEEDDLSLGKIKTMSFALIIITTIIIENTTRYFKINIGYLFMSNGVGFNSVDNYYAVLNCSGVIGALVAGILADLGINTNILQIISLLAIGLTNILIWAPGFYGVSPKMNIAVVLQGFLLSVLCTSNSLSINLKFKKNDFNTKFSVLSMIQSLGTYPIFKLLEMQSDKSNKYYFICMAAIFMVTSLLPFATYVSDIVKKKESKDEKNAYIDLYT